jgi:hypothetical protein
LEAEGPTVIATMLDLLVPAPQLPLPDTDDMTVLWPSEASA